MEHGFFMTAFLAAIFCAGSVLGGYAVHLDINEKMEKANNNPSYIAFVADCSKYDTPLNCLKKWSNK